MSLHDQLAERRLIVVTGKGGVGKSAVAATLGRSLAARGRRTLVLEVDPRENLHQLLSIPPTGGEMVPVKPGLWLQNLKPEAVVDWVVERQVKIGLLVRRVRASPVYGRFVAGAPGLKEMAIIGHAMRVVRGEVEGAPAIDTVVLDAPATGHGIYLLTASRLFAEAIGEGPFADLARQAADFVADPESCGVVVVTLAEEMPVEEALELRQALETRFGRAPELLVTNGLYPPLSAADQAEGDALHALWRRRRRINDRDVARLAAAWAGPQVELPLLPIDEGPELIAALQARLDAALEIL